MKASILLGRPLRHSSFVISFCEARLALLHEKQMKLKLTIYIDVISSWCFWAQPAWEELRKRYSDRVDFEWKIALMDASGFPKSVEQAEWFYRRSGMMMRSDRKSVV